ncbi:MAG TPA: hypothetical protein VGJ29_12185, partial [Vicinamibacterales bacterium]
MKIVAAVLALISMSACAADRQHELASKLALARTEMLRGELVEARALVENALTTTKPDSDAAWRLRLLRGEVLLLQSQPAEVVELVATPLPSDPRLDPL